MLGWVCLALAPLAYLASLARRVRHNNQPAYKFFCAVFIVGGIAGFFNAEETQRVASGWLSSLLPRPVSQQLLYLASGVLDDVASYCVVSMMAFALLDRELARRVNRRRFQILVGCAAAMVVLLFVVQPPIGVAGFGGELRLAAVQWIFTGYVAVNAGGFVVFAARYLRGKRRSRRMQISLSLEMIGGSLAVGWALFLGVGSILDLLGRHTVFDNSAVPEATSAVLFACMTVGASWLVWASATIRWLSRLWMWYLVRRLTPLWLELRPSSEPFVLDRPHGELPASAQLSFRCHRIMIEIRESEMRLAAWGDPRIREWAREDGRRLRYSAEDTEALVQAAHLRSAITAWTPPGPSTGDRPRTVASPAKPIDDVPCLSRGRTGPTRAHTTSTPQRRWLDPGRPWERQVGWARGLLRGTGHVRRRLAKRLMAWLGFPPELARQVRRERALLRLAKLSGGRVVMRLAERADREPLPATPIAS